MQYAQEAGTKIMKCIKKQKTARLSFVKGKFPLENKLFLRHSDTRNTGSVTTLSVTPERTP